MTYTGTMSVRILYTNWRGEKRWRHIRPLRTRFGATDWHPEPQELLDAIDLERGVERTFAISGIERWVEEEVATE